MPPVHFQSRNDVVAGWAIECDVARICLHACHFGQGLSQEASWLHNHVKMIMVDICMLSFQVKSRSGKNYNVAFCFVLCSSHFSPSIVVYQMATFVLELLMQQTLTFASIHQSVELLKEVVVCLNNLVCVCETEWSVPS